MALELLQLPNLEWWFVGQNARWVSVEKHQWRPDGSMMASPIPVNWCSKELEISMISRKHHETPTNLHQFFQVFGRALWKNVEFFQKLLWYHPCPRKIGHPLAKNETLGQWRWCFSWPILNQAASAHAETVGREWWPEPQHQGITRVSLGGAVRPRLGDLQLRLDGNDGKLKSLQEATTPAEFGTDFGTVRLCKKGDYDWVFGCHRPDVKNVVSVFGHSCSEHPG